MAKEVEVGTATAADIAADMEAHRRTYRSVMKLFKYGSVAVAVLLVIVFILLQ